MFPRRAKLRRPSAPPESALEFVPEQSRRQSPIHEGYAENQHSQPNPSDIGCALEPFRQPHEGAGIAALVDGVQKKTGKDALRLGYGGFRPGPSWQMKARCTPRAPLTGRSSYGYAHRPHHDLAARDRPGTNGGGQSFTANPNSNGESADAKRRSKSQPWLGCRMPQPRPPERPSDRCRQVANQTNTEIGRFRATG